MKGEFSLKFVKRRIEKVLLTTFTILSSIFIQNGDGTKTKSVYYRKKRAWYKTWGVAHTIN